MEPMQGKWASSRVDLGYTALFCIEVTSVFFSSCESVPGDSLEFHQANLGSLRVLLGTRNSSACKAGKWGQSSRRVGKSHGFSRVAAGKWGIFSSYGGDGHSKLEFIQQSQDSCLVMMDN